MIINMECKSPWCVYTCRKRGAPWLSLFRTPSLPPHARDEETKKRRGLKLLPFCEAFKKCGR